MSDWFPTEVEKNDPATYGLALPQPYPYGVPEELPRSAVNVALAASFVAVSGAGRLIGATLTNTKISAQFVLLFDSSTVPADTAVPILAVNVPATTSVAVYFGSVGPWFDRGVVWSNSSTMGTKTIGSADCLFDTQYIPQAI